MDSSRDSASALSFVFPCVTALDPRRWLVTFGECCVETTAE